MPPSSNFTSQQQQQQQPSTAEYMSSTNSGHHESSSSTAANPGPDGLQTLFKNAALAVTQLYKEAQQQQQTGYVQSLKDIDQFLLSYQREYTQSTTIPIDLVRNYLQHLRHQQSLQQQPHSASASPNPSSPEPPYHPETTTPFAPSMMAAPTGEVMPSNPQQQPHGMWLDMNRRKEDLAANSMVIARALEWMDDRQHPQGVQQAPKKARIPKRFME